jgi:hypothetical protein
MDKDARIAALAAELDALRDALAEVAVAISPSVLPPPGVCKRALAAHDAALIERLAVKADEMVAVDGNRCLTAAELRALANNAREGKL